MTHVFQMFFSCRPNGLKIGSFSGFHLSGITYYLIPLTVQKGLNLGPSACKGDLLLSHSHLTEIYTHIVCTGIYVCMYMKSISIHVLSQMFYPLRPVLSTLTGNSCLESQAEVFPITRFFLLKVPGLSLELLAHKTDTLPLNYNLCQRENTTHNLTSKIYIG